VKFADRAVAGVFPHKLEHFLAEVARRISGAAAPKSRVEAAGCCRLVGSPW
jgi:hypothetical protein